MKLTLLVSALAISATQAAPVITTESLVSAVRDGKEGATIEIAAGTYELSAPLEPKPGMTITGAGMDTTIITGAATWKPSAKTLPDRGSELWNTEQTNTPRTALSPPGR